jgi:hypothetical protein
MTKTAERAARGAGTRACWQHQAWCCTGHASKATAGSSGNERLFLVPTLHGHVQVARARVRPVLGRQHDTYRHNDDCGGGTATGRACRLVAMSAQERKGSAQLWSHTHRLARPTAPSNLSASGCRNTYRPSSTTHHASMECPTSALPGCLPRWWAPSERTTKKKCECRDTPMADSAHGESRAQWFAPHSVQTNRIKQTNSA